MSISNMDDCNRHKNCCCHKEEKFEVEERGLIDRSIIGMGYYFGLAFVFGIISLIYLGIKDLWESWSKENTFVYIGLKVLLVLVMISVIVAGIYFAKEYFDSRSKR